MSSRFARHVLIPDWSQERLAGATVVLVGMGALGNEVARVLALSGIGRLIICDPDHIEESNLSRTTLFREADIGKRKVDAAARALAELAPGIAVDPRPEPLVRGMGLAELRDASLVVGCLDSRSARLQLAAHCQLARAAYLDGGTHPWGGEVRPYFDPDGPCYGCSLTAAERGESDSPWSCQSMPPVAETGAAAPSSALVGTWMALVATRFLMGLGRPGGTLKIDGPRGTTSIVLQARDAECPLHHPIERARLIDVSCRDRIRELRAALDDGDIPLLWEPAQWGVVCDRCGFAECRWSLPESRACPQCGDALRRRTTYELRDAPDDITLTALGVPPREILAVRTRSGWKWVELSAEDGRHGTNPERGARNESPGIHQ